MKIMFGIFASAVFLVAAVMTQQADVITLSNTPVDHNPLRGAQSVLQHIHEQPLDFSQLDQPFSSDSVGTEIAGQLRINDEGDLIADSEFKAFMDYFLSSVGEVTPEQALNRMRLLFHQQLPGDAASQAMNILQQYLAFKEASYDALAQEIDQARSEYDAQYRYDTLQQGLQTLYDLRREHLGNQVANDMFYEEEAYAQYTLTNMHTALNPDLTYQERQQLRDLAKDQLPETMRNIIEEQEKQAQTMQAYNNKLSENPSMEEMQAFAFNHFDSESAQQITQDYAQQLTLKNKYAEFLKAQEAVQTQGLDPMAEREALKNLALTMFNHEELSMIQAWQLAQQNQ